MSKQITIGELLVEAAARIEAMAKLQGVSDAQKPFIKELTDAAAKMKLKPIQPTFSNY